MEPRGLLICDLDDTLLGDPLSLYEFALWYRQQNSKWGLVYATGRFIDRVNHTIETSPLPGPHAVIGGSGSEIHCWPSCCRLDTWQERVPPQWDERRVREILETFDELKPQPLDVQSPYKVSFYVPHASDNVLQQIREALQEEHIPAEVTYSHDLDLDVMPTGFNKGAAAAFLVDLWNVRQERVIVSGNAGNDRSLYEHSFYGIVPANAESSLRQFEHNRVYQAQRTHAGGVLEGIQHWEKLIDACNG